MCKHAYVPSQPSFLHFYMNNLIKKMKPESVDEMLSLEEQDCGVGGSNTLCSDAGDLGNGAGGLTVRRS